jgi:hypothetical protein
MQTQDRISGSNIEPLPTGTDIDEYKMYKDIRGVGEEIYDDTDSATDAAEFSRITGI